MPRTDAAVADQASVLAVLAGQQERFAELVGRYQNAVFAVALSYVREPHHAEDLTQEIFVRAFTALRQLRDPGLFGPWLLQIARHHAARGQHRKAAQLEQPLPLNLERPATENPSHARAAHVLSLVEQLPEPYRETLRLKYQEGLSCKEIAARDGVPIGTITSRLTRALVLLRTAVGK